jgi:hypothetical protein
LSVSPRAVMDFHAAKLSSSAVLIYFCAKLRKDPSAQFATMLPSNR